MSPEQIDIIVAAVGLAALTLCQGRQLGQRIDRLAQRLTAEIATTRDSQRQLREHMARLEGMIEAAFRLNPPEAA